MEKRARLPTTSSFDFKVVMTIDAEHDFVLTHCTSASTTAIIGAGYSDKISSRIKRQIDI